MPDSHDILITAREAIAESKILVAGCKKNRKRDKKFISDQRITLKKAQEDLRNIKPFVFPTR